MLHIIYSLLGYGLIDVPIYVNNSYHWIKGFVKEIVLKNKFPFTLNAFLSLYFVEQHVYLWDVIKYTRAHIYVCVCGCVGVCEFVCTFVTVWHSYMFDCAFVFFCLCMSIFLYLDLRIYMFRCRCLVVKVFECVFVYIHMCMSVFKCEWVIVYYTVSLTHQFVHFLSRKICYLNFYKPKINQIIPWSSRSSCLDLFSWGNLDYLFVPIFSSTKWQIVIVCMVIALWNGLQGVMFIYLRTLEEREFIGCY